MQTFEDLEITVAEKNSSNNTRIVSNDNHFNVIF